MVPNYLFGKQPFAREYSQRYKLPLMASLAGAASMYPEFAQTAMKATDADGIAMLSPAPGKPNATSKAVNPEPRDGEIHIDHVRGSVYLLLGDGANIVVSVGDQGAFVIDAGSGQLTDKVIDSLPTDDTLLYTERTDKQINVIRYQLYPSDEPEECDDSCE